MLVELVIVVGGLLVGFGCLALLLLFVAFLLGPPLPDTPINNDARMMSRLAPHNRRFGPILIAAGTIVILAVKRFAESA